MTKETTGAKGTTTTKRRLGALLATAVATILLAAGPASAEDVALLGDRFEDLLEHRGSGALAYNAGKERFG